MAKLQAPQNAGWNAGEQHYARMMRIDDIKIDPEIARVFKMSDDIRESIKESMRERGYDINEPLVLWKGRNVVLDGHTRLAAAREAGLDEVPVTELEFGAKDDAILYTFDRQLIRRNLTQAEIVTAVEMMPKTRYRRGQGRAVEHLAERLKVSPAHLYQIRTILDKASPEDVEAVRAGVVPVKETYLKLKNKVSPSLGTRGDLLKSVVVLLAEAKEKQAAILVVNHFFKKNEREAFIEALPQEVRHILPDILPVE